MTMQSFLKLQTNKSIRGYNWEWNYKDRNPNVPAIPFKYEDGSEKVIWVLEK